MNTSSSSHNSIHLRPGLLGGMSWESTALYYQWINTGIKLALGGLHSAPLLMNSVDFAEIEALQAAGDWQSAGARLAQAAKELEHAGADFIVICTNTMHKVARDIEAAINIPILHIADATAMAVQSQGIDRIGLIGTGFTMSDTFYTSRLTDGFNLSVLVPDDNGQRAVHDIIYQELCLGEINASSKARYLDVIESLAHEGAQGIILGCTEITLLVGADDTTLPVFDTTALHASAVVTAMLTGRID